MQYTRPHTRFLGTVSKYMYDTIRPSYRQFLPEIPKMSSRSPQNEVLGPYGTLKHSLVQPHGPKYSDITKMSWCRPIKSAGTGQTGNVPPNCIDCGVGNAPTRSFRPFFTGVRIENHVKRMILALSRPRGHIFLEITPSLLCERPGLVSWDPSTRIMHRGSSPETSNRASDQRAVHSRSGVVHATVGQ